MPKVEIVFGTRSDLPFTWRAPWHGSVVVEVDESLRGFAEAVVRTGLGKYPRRVLGRDLRRVVMFGELSLHSLALGGTLWDTTIFIAVGQGPEGHGGQWIESTMHHEFAHVLRQRHLFAFPHLAWRRCNPHGFRYTGGTWDMTRRPEDALTGSPFHYRVGFLNSYAMSAPEEDFCEIAEQLFLGEPEFWAKVDAYEALANKVRLAIRFYTRLDARLDEGFFRALGR